MPTLKMKLVFTMARQAEAPNLPNCCLPKISHGAGIKGIMFSNVDMGTWGHVEMRTHGHRVCEGGDYVIFFRFLFLFKIFQV